MDPVRETMIAKLLALLPGIGVGTILGWFVLQVTRHMATRERQERERLDLARRQDEREAREWQERADVRNWAAAEAHWKTIRQEQVVYEDRLREILIQAAADMDKREAEKKTADGAPGGRL